MDKETIRSTDAVAADLTKADLTKEEAAVAVCTLLAEADGDIREEEVQAIRDFSRQSGATLREITRYIEKELTEVIV